MFGIGWGELLVIAAVALVVLGPEKLPEAARAAGKIYGSLYRTMTEARENIRAELDLSALESKPRDEVAPPASPPWLDNQYSPYDEPADDASSAGSSTEK